MRFALAKIFVYIGHIGTNVKKEVGVITLTGKKSTVIIANSVIMKITDMK